MNATILHESRGRIRFQLRQNQMTLAQADLLETWLQRRSWCRQVTVHERTCCVILYYDGSRQAVLDDILRFSWREAEQTISLPAHSSRALNREFEDKLVFTVLRRAGSKLFLPMSIRTFIAVFRSIKYIKAGLSALLHGHLAVSVLDATAVTVSMLRSDFETASSVMFMLNLGEILEDWTHKKSVADLAGAMSLNVDKVWLKTADSEVLVPIGDVKAGDCIVVRTGGMIPLDGKVDSGEATVNQASITGESLPVPKSAGSYVYAGTVVEEGEFVVRVEKAVGGGRYDRIVKMIEESEKLKSTAEDKASRLADRLVPYTLGGTALTYLLTLGRQGIPEAAQNAVLNANYLQALLRGIYTPAYDRICMHEFVLDLSGLKKETGVSALDVAKSLIDEGIHPPTMYFPLIVHEALMLEPTETEGPEVLDQAAEVLRMLYQRAYDDPEAMHGAPHHMPIGRPDEVKAARHPVLRWKRA